MNFRKAWRINQIAVIPELILAFMGVLKRQSDPFMGMMLIFAAVAVGLAAQALMYMYCKCPHCGYRSWRIFRVTPPERCPDCNSKLN